MSKITLTNLVNLQNETTAVNAINGNNTVLTTALDNTLSRDGTQPNTMGATLDMNGYNIYNLPSPATVNSPARLIDVVSNPTIVVPPTGTSGSVVGLLNTNNTYSGNDTFSGNNTFSGTNTFSSLPSFSATGRSVLGNNQSTPGVVSALTTPALLGMILVPTGGTNAEGLFVSQTPSGIANQGTGLQQYNNLFAVGSSGSPDNVNCGDNLTTSYSIGMYVNHAFGGTSCHGGREAVFGNLILVSPTASTNGVRFYTAMSGQAQANVSDGGTIGGGLEKGRMYGSNMIGVLSGTATGFEQCSSHYDQIFVETGTSVKTKAIHQLVYGSSDAVQGSTTDAALLITAETGATAGGKVGILISNTAGANPLASTASILSIGGSPTITHGIDLTGATFTGSPFKSNLFSVDANGNVAVNSITTSAVLTSAPTTLTGTSGTLTSMSQIVNASGTFTLTLPAASANTGRWLYIKSIAAQIVNSASSNVVPIGSATAGTAILIATAGKYAVLQSDGTNWITMVSN